eukprot:m.73904 g.73904  ORF g.73904 m.73904 type:complete len:136 (+) comp35861_c0_seq2:657-1064(+)
MQFGEILHIKEVVAVFAAAGKSVRVLGRLQRYDVAASVAVLTMDNYSLQVDTKLLEPCPFRVNSLYQVIGEIESRSGETGKVGDIVLKARVYRQLDGLDTKLYYGCLQARRQDGSVAQELTEICEAGKEKRDHLH